MKFPADWRKPDPNAKPLAIEKAAELLGRIDPGCMATMQRLALDQGICRIQRKMHSRDIDEANICVTHREVSQDVHEFSYWLEFDGQQAAQCT